MKRKKFNPYPDPANFPEKFRIPDDSPEMKETEAELLKDDPVAPHGERKKYYTGGRGRPSYYTGPEERRMAKNERSARRRQKFTLMGLCSCGRDKPMPGKKSCELCLAYRAEKAKEYRQ